MGNEVNINIMIGHHGKGCELATSCSQLSLFFLLSLLFLYLVLLQQKSRQ